MKSLLTALDHACRYICYVALLAIAVGVLPARAQDTDGTGGEGSFCWEEWTLCEGSIPCPVEICVDDLVDSIDCSIDDSCDEADATPIPSVLAARVQYELSKPGGFIVGRRLGATAGQDSEGGVYACWKVGKRIVCEDLDVILGDCSINADCDQNQQADVPREVLDNFRVLYVGSTSSKWSYPACCGSCDCQVIPCTCTECSDDNTGSCPDGFATATCESDGNGTRCLDWDPQMLEGCCVFCPPGDDCQHCASATHDTCGALIKATCNLADDEFACDPAGPTVPVDLPLVSPDLVDCDRDEKTGRLHCSTGIRAAY